MPYWGWRGCTLHIGFQSVCCSIRAEVRRVCGWRSPCHRAPAPGRACAGAPGRRELARLWQSPQRARSRRRAAARIAACRRVGRGGLRAAGGHAVSSAGAALLLLALRGRDGGGRGRGGRGGGAGAPSTARAGSANSAGCAGGHSAPVVRGHQAPSPTIGEQPASRRGRRYCGIYGCPDL